MTITRRRIAVIAAPWLALLALLEYGAAVRLWQMATGALRPPVQILRTVP